MACLGETLGIVEFREIVVMHQDVAGESMPTIMIRRLWRSDLSAFRDHLLRLDTNSRRSRFSGGVSDDLIAGYAKSCFGPGDLLFGAFVDGVLRAVSELRSSAAIWTGQAPFDRHIDAEAAFSVEEGWQHMGIGEKLFSRIERAASNHGVETINIICMPENVSMRRLASRHATRFVYEEDMMMGRLSAKTPTPLSLMQEAASDILDFTASWFEAHVRVFLPASVEVDAREAAEATAP